MSAGLNDAQFQRLHDELMRVPPSTHVLKLMAADAQGNDLSLDDINALKAKRPVKGFWRQLPKYRRRKKS
jgi:hypothetical protein